MITSKIFERSQRHEWVGEHNTFMDWFNWHIDGMAFTRKNMELLDEIKPFQKVTSRYILDNQHYTTLPGYASTVLSRK